MRFHGLAAVSVLTATTAACGAARPAPQSPTTLAYAVLAPPPEPEPAKEAKPTSAVAPSAVAEPSPVGDEPSDEPRARAEAATAEAAEDERRIADGVPSANVRAAAIAKGMVGITDVSCRADDDIGALADVGALANPFVERRRVLERCAKGDPHVARVRWTGVRGRIVEARVISGADPSNRCVERALLGAQVPVAGTCAATVQVGVAKRR